MRPVNEFLSARKLLRAADIIRNRCIRQSMRSNRKIESNVRTMCTDGQRSVQLLLLTFTLSRIYKLASLERGWNKIGPKKARSRYTQLWCESKPIASVRKRNGNYRAL